MVWMLAGGVWFAVDVGAVLMDLLVASMAGEGVYLSRAWRVETPRSYSQNTHILNATPAHCVYIIAK